MALPDPSASDASTTPLVRELCELLEAEGVSYCHWKSNAFLNRSRGAENDLDLLVRRADGGAFSGTLHRLGFKAAGKPGASLPGVLDYYGYDRTSDAVVHVHAHYQLILGDDLTKNYRIPLERAFLEATVQDGEFRVPPPELELIVFVIRMALKHSTWYAVAARQATIPATACEELAFLRARVDEDALFRLLRQELPFVDAQSFADCLHALDGEVGLCARVRAGRRLIADLDSCARRSRAADVCTKLWRRGVGIVRGGLRFPAPRKRLLNGGAVIAVVGADGAGKSTVVDGLCRWLSQDFSVARIHLGKPRRSWTTMVVRAATKLKVAFAVLRSRRDSPSSTADTRSDSRPHVALAVATARDRYIAYRDARRIAGNGGLVICDRFPLPQLTLMDAPRLARHMSPGTASAVARRLASLEQRYYRALTLPDVLIVLRVDPEIAVRRKPDEQPDFVRSRWREFWEVDWAAVPAHVVDASRSPAEVLSEVKALVWSEI